MRIRDGYSKLEAGFRACTKNRQRISAARDMAAAPARSIGIGVHQRAPMGQRYPRPGRKTPEDFSEIGVGGGEQRILRRGVAQAGQARHVGDERNALRRRGRNCPPPSSRRKSSDRRPNRRAARTPQPPPLPARSLPPRCANNRNARRKCRPPQFRAARRRGRRSAWCPSHLSKGRVVIKRIDHRAR